MTQSKRLQRARCESAFASWVWCLSVIAIGCALIEIVPLVARWMRGEL